MEHSCKRERMKEKNERESKHNEDEKKGKFLFLGPVDVVTKVIRTHKSGKV